MSIPDLVIRHTHRDIRDQVFAIEDIMRQMPQAYLEVSHHFVPGVYIRELRVPKDTVLVGKIHKYKQFHWLMSGELEVLIGDNIERLKAPCIMITQAGSKRIARALEDTVWMMAHGTSETDIDKIEDHFIAKTENEWLDFCNQQMLLPLE